MYRQHYEYRVIMEDLYKAFLPLVDKVFITSRPPVEQSNPKTFIVIRLSSGVRDRADTYQTARVTVHIFVRDKAGNIEDAVTLDSITNAVCDLMPVVRSRFTAWNPNLLSSGQDAGFHYHILQLSLTINKKTLSGIKIPDNLDSDFFQDKY